jgi:hypothetical protein
VVLHTKRAVLTSLALIVLGGLATSAALAAAGRSRPAAPAWLATLNQYRAAAGLSPVVDNPSWSEQAREHAHYQVANGQVGPEQSPGAPFSSSGGAEAARNANLAGVSRPELTERQALDLWMSTPFHALGILRPELRQVGFGSWADASASPVQASAVLDVVRGLDPAAGERHRAIMWPGPGSVVPLTTYGGPEVPDPLAPCAGYAGPAGLPIVALLPADLAPTTATVEVDRAVVESCLVSATTYADADPATQALGRALLADDHAVIVIPRQPLPAVGEVSVALQAGASTHAWSFRTEATTGAILPAHPLA